MKRGAKFIVKGTVQGVFYRKFAKDSADALSLKGHVRNLESGDVEVVVEGDQDNIDKFEKQLSMGPQHAQIRSVSREDRKWNGDFSEFKTLRI